LKGYTKVPKEVKLDILKTVEASPVSKGKIIDLFDMHRIRYYRWQKKYYLDDCLDDKRGYNKKPSMMRIEDLYRKEIITIRNQGNERGFVVGPLRIMDMLAEQKIFVSYETIRKVLVNEGLVKPRPRNIVHAYKRFEACEPNEMWQIDII
jgi:hypothetical protein